MARCNTGQAEQPTTYSSARKGAQKGFRKEKGCHSLLKNRAPLWESASEPLKAESSDRSRRAGSCPQARPQAEGGAHGSLSIFVLATTQQGRPLPRPLCGGRDLDRQAVSRPPPPSQAETNPDGGVAARKGRRASLCRGRPASGCLCKRPHSARLGSGWKALGSQPRARGPAGLGLLPIVPRPGPSARHGRRCPGASAGSQRPPPRPEPARMAAALGAAGGATWAAAAGLGERR